MRKQKFINFGPFTLSYRSLAEPGLNIGYSFRDKEFWATLMTLRVEIWRNRW